MKRLLVTGSRTWTDTNLIRIALRAAVISLGVPPREIEVISGGAGGLDREAVRIARQMGMRIRPTLLPDYAKHGHEAPKVRNAAMVAELDPKEDLGLAFAERWASGTGHCARLARRGGICVVDYGVDTTMEARPAHDRGRD